jgi:hypothetical protein
MEEIEQALMDYAKYLFENRGDHIGLHQFIPIIEIDGMPVHVMIHIRITDVYIEIVHSNICGCCRKDKIFDIDHRNPTITVEEVYIILKKMTNVLDDLKLDKMSGRLSTTQKYYPTECQFLKSPNIKSKYQECCVCYDLTSTQSPCKHPLCIRCWGSIKIVGEDDDAEQPCPICREDLQQCNH